MANLGNAQPDASSLEAWIPPDGKCTAALQYPANYPVPNQFSTFDEYMETDQFDIIVIGMQEATWFDESGAGAAVSNMALIRYGANGEGDNAVVSAFNAAGSVHYHLDVYAVILSD